MAAAYGLGLYNIVGACVLVIGAVSASSPGLWSGAILHSVIAMLFVFALLTRR
jgi:hypothetical protein